VTDVFRSHFLPRAGALALVLVLATGDASAQMRDTTLFGWSSRKLRAVVLSTVIPGSGQSYLGHSTKGAVITLGFFGCGLITVLAENNTIGRNERLTELKALYSQTVDWVEADAYWKQMVETKDILDKDAKRRDLFLKLTAVFWVGSVVDAVFFSEDLGEQAFGSAFIAPGTSVALAMDPTRGMTSTLTYRF
jgi:TM2 domain-containing membrane protein YozV